VEVAGKQIANVSELLSSVAALKTGTQAKFRALRGRESLDLNVTPGLRPRPSKLPAQQR
jgi:S1-C subfamily serine protease